MRSPGPLGFVPKSEHEDWKLSPREQCLELEDIIEITA